MIKYVKKELLERRMISLFRKYFQNSLRTNEQMGHSAFSNAYV